MFIREFGANQFIVLFEMVLPSFVMKVSFMNTVNILGSKAKTSSPSNFVTQLRFFKCSLLQITECFWSIFLYGWTSPWIFCFEKWLNRFFVPKKQPCNTKYHFLGEIIMSALSHFLINVTVCNKVVTFVMTVVFCNETVLLWIKIPATFVIILIIFWDKSSQ